MGLSEGKLQQDRVFIGDGAGCREAAQSLELRLAGGEAVVHGIGVVRLGTLRRQFKGAPRDLLRLVGVAALAENEA